LGRTEAETRRAYYDMPASIFANNQNRLCENVTPREFPIKLFEINLRRMGLLKKPLVAVFLVLSCGVLAYSNSFRVPFVFDDLPSIVDNPVIRSLDNFLASTSGYENHERRFVGYLTFALNYRLGGLDVTGYHAFNLVVHLANALLLYALVRLAFRTPHLAGSRLAPRAGTVALLCGLLFVVHPVQTQAVTYVVQRLTSLATLFYLLAMVLYAVGRLKARKVSDGGGGRLGWRVPCCPRFWG